ncbi:CHAT domain-containing protein [Nocardia vulneris]|uniref:CHAT domain-containing protein n=1 Tax=Nocardia vulneris TaxID=1141657 RepID=UPI000691E509|nr:CHAT domain-containing protein [Nocardia vulneris]
MNDPAAAIELLVRAADAGDTYLSWTWLDAARTPTVCRLDARRREKLLDTLEDALPHPRPLATGNGSDARQESESEAVQRALTVGAFAAHATEHDLSTRLADALLPHDVRTRLAEYADDRRIRVRVAPSARLAQVPWELLVLDGDRRLLDIADIVYDPPATLHVGRSRPPVPWAQQRQLPPLHVIDPILPTSAQPALHNVFRHADDLGALGAFEGRVVRERRTVGRGTHRRRGQDRATRAVPALVPVQGEVTRVQLSAALLRGCSRFLYFGHVSATPNEPGSAAIHLGDVVGPPDEPGGAWGLAAPRGGAPGDARGAHLPLCALDFLLGTTRSDDPEVWARYGATRPQFGHEIWPMPSRVAIIACEGGVDFRSAETFGLIMAALDAGAELVTTTRWVLPTDAAFRACLGLPPTRRPTTDLALRVDDAHNDLDPVAALTRWQRDQLRAWRDTGAASGSPIVWAALTSTVAPAREPAEPSQPHDAAVGRSHD